VDRATKKGALSETTASEPVICLKDIVKTYGKGENKLTALDNVSLTVMPGEFVAILGPSGSGKTTLMNILGLMDIADSGEYVLDGIDIRKSRENVYARIRNEKIGFIFQKFNLISKYTALYNVALPLLLQHKSYRESKRQAAETLKRVGLGERMNHKPTELSGGQMQRVAIARALVSDCSLILADEPTGNLDRKTGQEVIEFLQELNREGKTIVMITHNEAIAEQASRIVRVEDGRIIA